MKINKKKLIKISVLITVFNEEKYIEKSLKSIIKQSFTNWEAIIIDDNSSDNTAKIIKKFKDRRINFFKLNKHLGRRRAINFGLKKCKGNFISILDADDSFLKNKLMKQAKFIKQNENVKFLATWANIIDKKHNKIILYKTPIKQEDIKKKLLINNILGHSTIIFDKNFANHHKLTPYRFKYAVDYELILKFLKYTKIYVLTEPLADIVWRNDSISSLKKNKLIIIKDDLKCLNYAQKNIKHDLKDSIMMKIKKLKLLLKLSLSRLGII